MLHYILVKWNDGVNKQETAETVRALYATATEIPGVHRVEIQENVTPRPNRYDLMILLHMDAESLPVWDESPLHQQWKQQFGSLIEKKCIFDGASATS